MSISIGKQRRDQALYDRYFELQKEGRTSFDAVCALQTEFYLASPASVYQAIKKHRQRIKNGAA